MAQVPVSMQVIIYPRDKSLKPYPATLVGYAWLTGLEVGGGPMPGGEPHPEHPIELPPVDQPPPEPDGSHIAVVVKDAPASGGWGFAKDECWYYSPGSSGANSSDLVLLCGRATFCRMICR